MIQNIILVISIIILGILLYFASAKLRETNIVLTYYTGVL